jgi:hypothetical protein
MLDAFGRNDYLAGLKLKFKQTIETKLNNIFDQFEGSADEP